MPRQPDPTHAGGIVFRDSASGPEYLVVEARRDPGVWVLPKGHIEDGETEEEAAGREVEEEAGSKADVIGRLGVLQFDDIRVVLFLMRHVKTVPRKETRRLFWGSYEQARTRLSFTNTQNMLARAHDAVTRRP
jgi:8-oxo-dGTP pyrophosphatase MutT (NUDIX family)